MGPFELNDFNGLDVGLYNANSLREAYGERFAAPQSLLGRVRAGMLGRKPVRAGTTTPARSQRRSID